MCNSAHVNKLPCSSSPHTIAHLAPATTFEPVGWVPLDYYCHSTNQRDSQESWRARTPWLLSAINKHRIHRGGCQSKIVSICLPALRFSGTCDINSPNKSAHSQVAIRSEPFIGLEPCNSYNIETNQETKRRCSTPLSTPHLAPFDYSFYTFLNKLRERRIY